MFAAAFAASPEQDDVIADDVGHVFLLAGLLVVPGVGSNAAFDVYLAAFLEILSGDLRQPLPEHDVVPLGAILPLAVFVLVALVGGQGKLRHRLALRRVLNLGILAKVSNQDDFVYAFHQYGSFKTLTIAELGGPEAVSHVPRICDESGGLRG